MKSITQYINTCRECPKAYVICGMFNDKWVCPHVGNLNDLEIIHKDCPLEDVKVAEAKVIS